jgi:CheY-like chemotaxis protein
LALANLFWRRNFCDMARILIVEDHADSSEALAIFLKRKGHSIECAANGREALARIVDHPPELIMLDLNLPQMNGADLVDTLRSYVRLHSLPVIVVTASPDGPLATRAKSLQVSAILAKGSTTLDEISATIEATLAESLGRADMPLEKWRQDEISPL